MLQEQNTRRGTDGQAGFTLIEMLVSMLVLMVVSATVMRASMDMVRSNETLTNRANMHAGLRNATALLQQEVGQAGRVSLPAPATLAAAVVGPGVATVAVSSAAGMFVGEHLVIGTGVSEETVTLIDVDPIGNTIRADFFEAHAVGSRVASLGGFWAGVIPTTMADGSTGNVLKIVGDINGDGNMVYVEYTCDLVNQRLSRNVMAWNALPPKPPLTVEQILLTNLQQNPANPGGGVPPCFTYQQRSFAGRTFVIGVAITTTVQTQDRDPITGDFQRVTKALLNVSPRNVLNVWQLASLDQSERVQPLPPSVMALLP